MKRYESFLCFAFFAMILHSLAETSRRSNHRSQPDYQSVIGPSSVPKLAVLTQSPPLTTALPSSSKRKQGSKRSPLIVTPKDPLPNTLSFPEIVARLKLPLTVVQFISTSMKQIVASDSLKRAFGVTNKAEGKTAYFEALENMMSGAGVRDIIHPAKKATKKFINAYDNLNSFKHALSIMISIGKYLFEQGVLTQEGADDAAHTLLAQMSTLVDKVNTDSDTLYYRALVDGLLNYILPLKVFGPDNAPLLLEIFDQIVPYVAAYSLPDGFV